MISILYVIVGGAILALGILELHVVGWLVDLWLDPVSRFPDTVFSGLVAQLLLAIVLTAFYWMGRGMVEISLK